MTASESLALRREQLLGRLVASAAPRGYRIAYDLLGNREEAEDAVQEALARACESCSRLRDVEAIDGWFYRVLTNLCLRALRRRRLRRLFFGTSSADEDAGPPMPDELRADRELARRRDIASLLRAIDRLPDKQRAALLLRYGHELPVEQVASMLGVSPATAKTHLIRGLRRLRTLMERVS